MTLIVVIVALLFALVLGVALEESGPRPPLDTAPPLRKRDGAEAASRPGASQKARAAISGDGAGLLRSKG